MSTDTVLVICVLFLLAAVGVITIMLDMLKAKIRRLEIRVENLEDHL